MNLLFFSPPEWMQTLSGAFLEHIAPWAYLLLTITHVSIWFVLHWQRVGGETLAAKWFRRFILSKAFLWLALLLGRTATPGWRNVLYSVVTIYVVIATTTALWALYDTYVCPVVKYRLGKGPRPTRHRGVDVI